MLLIMESLRINFQLGMQFLTMLVQVQQHKNLQQFWNKQVIVSCIEFIIMLMVITLICMNNLIKIQVIY